MYSQQDLQAYERVRNALAGQHARKNTGLKVSLAITLFLLLIAVGRTAFLSYNIYYLNNAHLRLQGSFARVVTELNETLNQANENVHTLNRSLDTERNERNAAVTKLNRNVESLAQQVQEERELVLAERKRGNQEIEKANREIEKANREIEKANGIIADKEERINYYTEANAALENSARQLEATNDSLTRKNRTLTGEKNSLAQRNSTLSSGNRRLTSSVSTLNSRVSSLQSQLTQAKAQQVAIPNCASNYYTAIGGKLSCVARNSNAFQVTQTETSTVRLPHSGIVNLKINRSGELGSDRSMEILEHAVKTIEEYMGEPIPLKGNEIRLDFVNEINSPGSPAGTYKETLMEVLEEYDSEKPRWGDDKLGMIVAHEVAHYYFSGERDWLNEGAAEFLAIYVENKRVGRAINSLGKECTQASTIRDLESRKYKSGDDGFTCNYTLGEGLFLDLYGQIEQEDFRKAFRELYTTSDEKKAGIYQVRQAFYPGSEWVQKIIDEWYGYREKPEAHWPDGSFLAYYTWQKDGKWWRKVQEDKPCALRISYDESSRRFTSHSSSICQLTGEWDENKDLIVTVQGKSYRAVEIRIAKDPDDYSHNVEVPEQHYGRLMVR